MKKDAHSNAENDATQGVRLDIWLWAVRIYKTRSLATKEIKAGRVKLNGQKKKPSSLVDVGDNIEFRKPPYDFHIVVDAILEKRVGAPLAQECYHETAESIEKRKQISESVKLNNASISFAKGRPTKKDRREFNKLKGKDI